MDGYGRGARERRVPHLRCCSATCVRAFAANWLRIEGPLGFARQEGAGTRFRFLFAADLLFARDFLLAAGFSFCFAAGVCFFAAGVCFFFFAAGVRFFFAGDFFFAAGFTVWHRFSAVPAMG